jgi:hypothetical protein
MTAKRARRAVLRRDGHYVSLTHLDTAAYLFAKDLPIEDAWRAGSYQYNFVFYDPDHRAEDLAIEFVNSFCADYADAVKRLKSVIYQFSSQSERSRKDKEKAAKRRSPRYSD